MQKLDAMITVEEASKIVLEHRLTLSTEDCPIEEAIGRVLMEDLHADRDFPPYNRVAMDGIGIHFDAFANGQRVFPIQGVSAAGDPQMTLQNPEHCVEIMTGAVLAEGADTIIRYEDLTVENGSATINIDNITKGQNIHWKGLDRKAGTLVVPKGMKLSSPEIGVAATVGKRMIKVAKMPSAIIISSGDELVEIDEKPLPHQIRKSNVYRLQATLKSWGIQADTAHLIDDEAKIVERLKTIVEEYDVIIMSGGVSKGKFDFIPSALAKLGVEKLFHKIKQRPGKPFWFGKAPNGCMVFALPGNPVSSFMCTNRYFKPWLNASLGLEPYPYAFAKLAEDVHFKPDLTYFMQAKVSYQADAQIAVHPVHGHGSGDLANLVDADVFVELPKGKDLYKAGEIFRILPYR